MPSRTREAKRLSPFTQSPWLLHALRVSPLDADIPRAEVPLPDLRLPAVHEAPDRRGVAARLPLAGVPVSRARRGRGHDRGAA